MFKSIRWKLMVVYLLMILFAMQLIGLYFMKSLEDYHLRNHSENIYSQANVLADFLERYFIEGEQQENRDLDTLVRDFAKQIRADIQIIDANAIIISDSSGSQYIGQRNVQLEVTRALLGARGEAIRSEPETGFRVKIFATPIRAQNEIVGAVYITSSLEPIYNTLKEVNTLISTATVLVLVISSALVIILARTITTPLVELTGKATDMANGDFNQQVTIYSDDEIGKLGLAFNQLTLRLKSALEDNKKEKQRLEAILNNMSDGVIATSSDGKILLINPTAQQMIGISEEKAMIKNILDILEIDELKKDWFDLKERTAFQTIINHKTSLYQVVVSPLKTTETAAYGMLVILHDITEREQLDQQRREFVANVSHELRTPLTTIRSYVEALVEGADSDPEIRQRFTGVIQNETERMIRLVTDLLELSQLDAKNISWNFRVLDLNEVIEDVFDRFHVQFNNKGIEGNLSLIKSEVVVLVDRDRIDQVLNNLLSNAVKYTSSGGVVKIENEIIWSKGKRYVQVRVKDTGIGIPPKDTQRVFERFYRVDKARSRDFGGTGLGLSISKQIILAHNGLIEIQSKVDEGTTVKFTLPLHEEGLHDRAD
ncbi:ATP-binding protein [Desulfuribacillus alkaliarsenatis]|uniref:histidine kinase n=1 Tax=Desulfuribacillus alkaliarsenatis TaxID=766136 RepID=A0A1E5G2P0_9FIRM|nr:ATP-binding protein [Desulfuribacillus alkaliarsenatis]OEF97342.1 hypothetical protein BHF68_03790 [Desulfuribacillus alkaliarsenatis]